MSDRLTLHRVLGLMVEIRECRKVPQGDPEAWGAAIGEADCTVELERVFEGAIRQ